LTEEAVEEVFQVIADLVESEERTQTLMDNARLAGLPALVAQAEHFARVIQRYIATVQGRLVQLLPLVRGSMADQSIILKYVCFGHVCRCCVLVCFRHIWLSILCVCVSDVSIDLVSVCFRQFCRSGVHVFQTYLSILSACVSDMSVEPV
jgi:hypothetical protein